MNNESLQRMEETDSSSSLTIQAGVVHTALRAQWPWACAALFVALAAGVYTWQVYSQRQEFAGTVTHTPLPATEASKHLLPQADLKSLSTLLKSPENLKAVVAREHLDITPQTLADRLDAKSTAGSPMVSVSLQWRGPGDGAAVLDDVLAQFVLRAGELRKQRIEERVKDFQAALAVCESELLAGRQQLSAFYSKNGLYDLPHEISTAQANHDALGLAVTQSRRGEATAQAQIVQLDKTIDKLAAEENADAAGTRPTPQRLQRLIEEERTLHQAEAKLEIKHRQRDRVQSLIASGASSPAELDPIDAEIAVLDSQVKDNKKIQDWKAELANLDRTAQPLLQQVLAKKLEVDLQRVSFRNELPLLEAEYQAGQSKLVQLIALQSQGSAMLWQVERGEAERARLQGHLNELRVFQMMGAGEATVSQAATAVPTGANRQWLVPAAVVGCILLLATMGLVFRHGKTQPRLLEASEQHSISFEPTDDTPWNGSPALAENTIEALVKTENYELVIVATETPMETLAYQKVNS